MAESRRYCDPEVLARIAGLAMRARRVVEGTLAGMHRSPFRGFNVEFAEYREYAPGDDLRRLDWRALLRSDRLYLKQYEEESNLRATLVVDASASMRYGPRALSKFDYAATLAASLATLLVAQRDPVGLVLCDDQPREVLRPAATQAQLARIVETLEQARADRTTELGSVLARLSETLPPSGLLVVISDLLTDLDQLADGLARLAFRGHEVVLLQVLDRDELELPFRENVLFCDLESSDQVRAEPWAFRRAYRAAIQDFLAEVGRLCQRLQIDQRTLFTDDDPGDALARFLHARKGFH